MNQIILYDDNSFLKYLTSNPTKIKIITASPIIYPIYRQVEWFTSNDPFSCIIIFRSSIVSNAYIHLYSTFISYIKVDVLDLNSFSALCSATLSRKGAFFVIYRANNFPMFPNGKNRIMYLFPLIAWNLNPWVT